MTNSDIAANLEQTALLLEQRGANTFRVRAYREAANTVRGSRQPVAKILEREGRRGLEKLEGIGPGLAGAIEEMVNTGHYRQLDVLRAETTPEATFETLPGIGPELARRIHQQLGITTLEELEMAANDGRLEQVPGIGPARTAEVRDVLATRLRRRPRGAAAAPPLPRPPVAELLDVDREYRSKARAGKLYQIAPRRFNPGREAWLPVLNTRRGPRRYTALYSNTKLAHDLNKTHDWVVLYYRTKDREDQVTVVTGTSGELKGKRVVRGREQETQRYYERERVKSR
ncbi:MAG: helix-hairpin-helix domain-containing protein [Anaerolineae bacterium]